jgi:hypothetical protein
MEYFMPRHANNESTAGNGVLCGTAPIVTSCNNIRTVGSGVSCWVHPAAISREATGQVNQCRGVKSRESAVSSWETDPSERSSQKVEAWEAEGSHCCKSLLSKAGSCCEIDAGLRGREPGSRGTRTAGRCYQAAQ